MTSLVKDTEKAVETFSRVAAIHTDMAYLAERLQEMTNASQQDMYRIMEGMADWALERKDDWSDANYAKSLEKLLNRDDPAGDENPADHPAGHPAGHPADHPADYPSGHPADGIPAA